MCSAKWDFVVIDSGCWVFCFRVRDCACLLYRLLKGGFKLSFVIFVLVVMLYSLAIENKMDFWGIWLCCVVLCSLSLLLLGMCFVSGRKGHLGIVDMINLSLIREFQVCSVLVELSMWGFTFTNKFLNTFYVSEHCLIFFFSRVMFIMASLVEHHLVLILTIHILKHCFYLSE